MKKPLARLLGGKKRQPRPAADTFRSALRAEPLEDRLAPAVTAVGTEFRANTSFTGTQTAAAVAADADGDFVVVWSGAGPGDAVGVYAQRYSAAGAALGTEFRVNTSTAGDQTNPAVAMDADGDFVVTWTGTDASSLGVYAQRFSAAGAARGSEFRVNTTTASAQYDAAVAADADGDFVVVWTSSGQDGSGYGVYAQRYTAAGAAAGAEFLVNTFTTGNQSSPAVAMDADGDFVVVWHSFNQDGSGLGVYGQRYAAAGVAAGTEFQVNTFTTGSQGFPAVAADADGDFVVAWRGEGQDGSGAGVYARRYTAAGTARDATEFQVNTTTTGNQIAPAAATDADGDFVVAWQSAGQDGSGYGVYARRYTAAGTPQGGEFRVNTFTASDQVSPVVGVDAEGDFVVAWTSAGQDPDGSDGVYAQRYDESADAAGPVVADVLADGDRVEPGERLAQTLSQLVLTFSEELSVAGGTAGANSATNPANYRLTRNGSDVSGQITAASFAFNATTRRYEATLAFAAALGNGDYVLTARGTLRDLAGNGLDGDLNGTPGGDFTRPFSVEANQAPTGLALSNTRVAENQPANTVVGTLSTTDPDAGDTHAYALVPGFGDTGNASFTISGNELRTAAPFNFEARSAYSVRVRTTDAAGATFDRVFVVDVDNVAETFTWDGGGADDRWTTGANWAGDHAPTLPGDSLVFAPGAARLGATNDFAAGTAFASVTLSGGGYTLGGNAVELSGGLTDSAASGTNTVALALGGSGGVVKSGTGTLALSGANTYTGATAVDGGTLLLDGALDGVGGAVAVNNTGTLGGAGTTARAVTVNGGGTLSPGTAGAGLLRTGSVTFASGSALAAQLDGATAGTGHDQLRVAGAVDLGGATLSATAAAAGVPFTVVDNDGTDAVAGTFAGLAEGAAVAVSGRAYTITYRGGDGNDVVLSPANRPPVIGPQTFAVAENSPNGTAVGAVVATDPDAGQTLSFAITGGNTGGAFAINAGTGQITVANAAALDFETTPGFTLTVRVTDDGLPALSASAAVTVNLTNVNEAPAVSDAPNQTTPEDAPVGPIAFTVGDPDAGAVLTVTATSSNQTLVPNGSIVLGGSGTNRTVAITPAADQSGTATITLTVSDGSLTAVDTFVLTVTPVNDAPTDLALSNTSVGENQPVGTAVGTLSTTDPDAGDTHTYALVPGFGDNGLFSVSGNTLRTAAVFNFEARSSYAVRVRAADAGGLPFERTFTVTVTDVNEAPTDITLTGGSVPENSPGGTLVGTLSAADPDAGDTFTYSLLNSDGGRFRIAGDRLEVADGAVLDFEASATRVVRVRATDAGGLATERDLAVALTNVNEAPAVSNIPDQSTPEDVPTGPIPFTVGDPETAAAVLTVTGSSSNPALVPNANIVFGGSGANRTVTITPAPNQTGTATITVTASDGTLTAVDTFVLTVGAVNDPPTISDVPDQSTPEDTPRVINFAVGDAETAAGSLTVTAASSNPALVPAAGLVLGGSGANRTLTVTPAANQSGTATITITASDGTLTAVDTFVLTVTPVNDPPTVSNIADQTTPEDTPRTVGFTVGDVETAAGSLALAGSSSDQTLVPNASITFGGSGASRTVRVSPAANRSGTATITVTVSDGQGGTASDTFVLTVTPVNDPPVLAAIADRTVPSTQDVVTVGLSATDADGDPVTFAAAAQSLAYVLDQQLGLFSDGSLYENFGGRGEKWVQGAGGTWYFVLPTGELFRWDGGPGANGTPVGNVGASYHASPALLYNAQPNQPRAALSVTGSQLTVDRDNGFIGAVVVTVTASDGRGGTASRTFTVTVTGGNRPPVLAAVADRTVPSTQDVVTVPLSATDPDGDAVTYTATAQSLAYVLDQQLGFFSDGNLYRNFGGRDEKWVQGAGGTWYFVLPTGELFRWDGGPGANGTPVGNVGAGYWAQPALLYNATPNPRAALSVTGNTLTIDRDNGFVGAVVVTVTASDGRLTDTRTFTVTVVTNRPPVLAAVADRTVPSSQDVVTVPLSATDPDGDVVALTATAQSLAYVLDQQLGLRTAGNLYQNFGGRNEKWVIDAQDRWHFILPNGEFYRWDGGPGATGTLVGNPGAGYWAQPALLYNATPNPRAAVSVSGNQLTIDRNDGFVGAVVVTVTASDGRGGTDARTFTVTVTSP